MLGIGGGVAFDAERDIPDLSGKVALVTGGTCGRVGIVETMSDLSAFFACVHR